MLSSTFSQSDTLFCYKTKKPISINGILSEWNNFDSIAYNGNKTIERGRSDNSAITKFTWDDEKLYIAFKVQDTELVSKNIDNDTNIWDDDCIEIYLSTQADSKTFLGLSQNEYHFLVNLNNTKATFKGKKNHLLDENSEGVLNWNTDILSGVTINGSLNDSLSYDNGYIIEMAIFWKSINIEPKHGTVILIDFCIEDNDYNKPLGFFDYAGLEQLFARPFLWKKMMLKDDDLVDNSKVKTNQKHTYKSKLFIVLSVILLLAFISFFFIKKKKNIDETNINEAKTTSDYHQDKAEKIIEIIEYKYTDLNLTANIVANEVNISERHLRRIIKDVYNESFTEILSAYRAKKGAILLIETLKTITEISHEVGCTNLVQFTRVFKKEFETTPSNYRKNKQLSN